MTMNGMSESTNWILGPDWIHEGIFFGGIAMCLMMILHVLAAHL